MLAPARVAMLRAFVLSPGCLLLFPLLLHLLHQLRVFSISFHLVCACSLALSAYSVAERS